MYLNENLNLSVLSQEDLLLIDGGKIAAGVGAFGFGVAAGKNL
ncbi:hypothetical protein [Lysinibacillus sp. NPDC059133]